MKRIAVTVTAMVLALLVTAAPAMAHNVLVSSDPVKGSALSAGPTKITLTFDAPVQPGVNQVAVTGPDGGAWVGGAVEVKGNVVTAPLLPLGPAGNYTVGYRIVSADGHPVSDEFTFTLTQAGAGTPAPVTGSAGSSGSSESGTADGQGNSATENSNHSTGIPVWAWIVGAVVLLGVGLTVALRAGGSKQS